MLEQLTSLKARTTAPASRAPLTLMVSTTVLTKLPRRSMTEEKNSRRCGRQPRDTRLVRKGATKGHAALHKGVQAPIVGCSATREAAWRSWPCQHKPSTGAATHHEQHQCLHTAQAEQQPVLGARDGKRSNDGKDEQHRDHVQQVHCGQPRMQDAWASVEHVGAGRSTSMQLCKPRGAAHC